MKECKDNKLVKFLLPAIIIISIIIIAGISYNYIKKIFDNNFLNYSSKVSNKIIKYSLNHTDEYKKYPKNDNSIYVGLSYIYKDISKFMNTNKYKGFIALYSDNSYTISIKDKKEKRCVYLPKTKKINYKDIKYDCKNILTNRKEEK